MAMTRHYTNILLNEGQKRATTVIGQIGLLGITPSLSEFTDNETSAGTFGTNVVMLEDGAQFGIPVSGVEKSVCENLLKMTGTTEESIQRLSQASNPETPFTVCSDENSFLMVYDNVMRTNKECIKDTDCETVCGVCSDHGFCINECEAEDVECTKATEKTDCQGSCVGCVVASGETKGTCQSCTPVEYLESTGTQYIDTGVSVTMNDSFRYDIVGNFTTFNETYQLIAGLYTSAYFGVTTTTYKQWCLSNALKGDADLNEHSFYLYSQIGNNKVSYLGIDGVEYTQTRASNAGGTLHLFNINSHQSQYSPYFRIKNCKIRKNSVNVRDFVPVLDWDDKPAMYDKISNTVFYNKGSGSFKTNLN